MANTTTNTEIILLPGLFEDANSEPLCSINRELKIYGYKTHEIIYSKTQTLIQILSEVHSIVDRIKTRNKRAVIIGHSLGAFIGLSAHANSDKIICLDISLHPSEVFKSIVCDKNSCKFLQDGPSISLNLVNSLKSLPSINSLLIDSKKDIIFIGAKFAGASISKKYSGVNPTSFTYIEFPCDHNFTGQEMLLFEKILELINPTS